jgi:hypothetical protein
MYRSQYSNARDAPRESRVNTTGAEDGESSRFARAGILYKNAVDRVAAPLRHRIQYRTWLAEKFAAWLTIVAGGSTVKSRLRTGR